MGYRVGYQAVRDAPGERSVWQLVVDKARGWMGLDGVGVEDITQLEMIAGEVLKGVVVSLT